MSSRRTSTVPAGSSSSEQKPALSYAQLAAAAKQQAQAAASTQKETSASTPTAPVAKTLPVQPVSGVNYSSAAAKVPPVAQVPQSTATGSSNGRPPSQRMSYSYVGVVTTGCSSVFSAQTSSVPNYAAMAQRANISQQSASRPHERKSSAGQIQFGSVGSPSTQPTTLSAGTTPSATPYKHTPTPSQDSIASSVSSILPPSSQSSALPTPSAPSKPSLASIVAAGAKPKPAPVVAPPPSSVTAIPEEKSASSVVMAQPSPQTAKSGEMMAQMAALQKKTTERVMPHIPRTMSAPPEMDQDGQLSTGKAAPSLAKKLGPQNAWSKPITVKSKLSQDLTNEGASSQQMQPPTGPASMQQQQQPPHPGHSQQQASVWSMQQSRHGAQPKPIPGQQQQMMPMTMAMSPQGMAMSPQGMVAGSPSMMAGIPMPMMQNAGSPQMAAGMPGWPQGFQPMGYAAFPPNMDPQQMQAYYQQMYAMMGYGQMRPGMMMPGMAGQMQGGPGMMQQSPQMQPGMPPAQQGIPATPPQQQMAAGAMPQSPRTSQPLFSPPVKGPSRAIKIVNPNTGEVLNTSVPSTPKTPAHATTPSTSSATATEEKKEDIASPPTSNSNRAIAIVHPETKKPVDVTGEKSRTSTPVPEEKSEAKLLPSSERESKEDKDKLEVASNASDGASVASEVVPSSSSKKRKNKNKKKKKKNANAGAASVEDGEDEEMDDSVILDEPPKLDDATAAVPSTEVKADTTEKVVVAEEAKVEEIAEVMTTQEATTQEEAATEKAEQAVGDVKQVEEPQPSSKESSGRPTPTPIHTRGLSEESQDTVGSLPSVPQTAPLVSSMSTPVHMTSPVGNVGAPSEGEPKRKASMPPPGLGMPPGLGGSGTPIGPSSLRMSGSGKALKIPPGLAGMEMARSSSTPGQNSPTASGTGLSGATTLRSPDSLGAVQYPSDVKPFASQQASTKLKYDHSFLMKFMDVIKDKPPGMNVDALEEKAADMQRTPSGGRRVSSRPASMAGRPPPGMGIDPAKMSSDDRFNASRTTSGGRQFTPAGGMQRTTSGGMGMPDKGKRMSKAGSNRPGMRSNQGGPTIPMDQVAPLAMSETRWKPTDAARSKDETEVIQRKVKALLNKLTLEKFDTISDKILEFANMSTKERDGATLRLVIQLVFEKATDEPNFSSMYAKLAHKMLTTVSPDVKDESVLNKEGQVMGGGPLFRKYLLNRCQEEFEKGWKANLPNTPSVDELMSDEYYVAMKAKRRGLGLIQFIGELFKLEMLTEKIMHECVRRLLTNVQDPEEEETESLCKLMNTVGKQLDRYEARNFMDVYFSRIRELSQNKKLSSRIRFMLLDLIELRADNWVPRRAAAGPKTIAEIHKDAEKAKAEAEATRRAQSSGGRGMPPMHYGDRRGGPSGMGGGRDRRDSVNKDQRPGQFPPPDGWNTVGGGPASANAPPQTRKTSDLSGFGNLNRAKGAPSGGLGPGGAAFFGGMGKGKEDTAAPASKAPPGIGKAQTLPSKSGAGLAANAFSALMDHSGELATSPPAEATSPPVQRRPLKLLPRGATVPTGEATESPLTSAKHAPSVPSTPTVTGTQLRKRIDNLIKEYCSVNDKNEVILSLKELGPEAPEVFVDAALDFAINGSSVGVNKMATLFGDLAKEGAISEDVFDAKFKAMIPMLDDLMLDSPHADRHLAFLMQSARLSINSAIKAVEAKEIPPSHVKFVAEFLKLLRANDAEGFKKVVDTGAVDLKRIVGKSDEAIAAFLEKHDLFDLNPSLKMLSHLKEVLGKDDGDKLITWFERNIPKKTRETGEFVRVFSMAIIKYMASQTIFPDGATKAMPVTPEIVEKEKAILKMYVELFKLYSSRFTSQSCQSAPLRAATTFAEHYRYPDGWLLRMFTNLKDLKVLTKEHLDLWRAGERKMQRFQGLVEVESLIDSMK